LTSGIITTLGLIVGLYSSTESKLVVIGGIFVIAIADALSDSMGIHISEEAEKKHPKKEIWESTFTTFISKFIFALSFVIPILLFQLNIAIIISIIWGFFLIATLSFYISKENKKSTHKVIIEHLVITIFVIIITYYLGKWINVFVS
jgi:VIT1/CCC1 family predicted Fe2+/Mn2+ transporter